MNKHNYIQKRFDQVFDLQMGKTPNRKTPSFFGGNNVWLSIRDMGPKYLYESNEHITDDAVKASGIKMVKRGTVIMSFKLTVGKCGITSRDLYTNEAIMAFNVKEGFYISPDFLYFYLQGYKWQGTNKAVMGLTLNKATISKQIIDIPPMEEQERIVAELDLLSGVIEKKKEQLKAYDQLAQSIFYSMFGDPITNEKGWEIKKLQEAVSVKGRVGWKGYKKEDLRESGPLAIGGSHITENGSMDFSSPVFLSKEKFDESPEIIVKRGDLILVQRGTIGRIGLIRDEIGDATINPCVLILRPLSVNGIYLLNLILNKSAQDFLGRLVRGVAQPMITQKQVNSLNIPLPPISLQEEFAEKIEGIERQKALIQQSIKETETLFNSRMDYYFN